MDGIEAGIEAARGWPAAREVTARVRVDTRVLYPELYARLAPGEPPLPPDGRSPRGDGVLEVVVPVWLVAMDNETFHHLLVDGTAHFVTSVLDVDNQGSPSRFEIRAPTEELLERAVSALEALL